MQAMSVLDLAACVGGEVVGDGTARFDSVGIDTRRIGAGALFVALRGSRVDGHDFLGQAAAAGAAGALVERAASSPLPQVRVTDAREALWALAARVRAAAAAGVVGLTGSNGKTTVKEMLASILGRLAPTLWTEGNLNNELGVPLTLCRLNPEHRYAVIEMGANHPGEIARLAALARPHVGLVNNAGAAHLEGFGSLQGVAEAKGELYTALAEDGVAVVNVDDRFAGYWLGLAAPRRCLSFSLQGPGDVWAEDAAPDNRFLLRVADDSHWVRLPLPGRHNVMNALAAAAAATALGIGVADIAAGLETVQPVAGRLSWRVGRAGLRVLDDTYNANPGSLAAAVEVLSAVPGPRWVVLGDMAELGGGSEVMHREAGRQLRQAGVDRLFACGPHAAASVEAFGSGGQAFAGRDELIAALEGAVCGEEAILVKGSRSMAMERVVAALQAGQGSAVGRMH